MRQDDANGSTPRQLDGMSPPPRTAPVTALKRQLAEHVVAITSGWSQWEIGVFLGLDQPRMSDLRNGRARRFTIDRLVKMLDRLRHDVHVEVRHRTGKGIFARRTP